MKKLNKLSLSLVVGSLLFTQSYALPSGGKFTHGTSGTININGNTMNITGNKVNSVIQWGGGFNIASGETVNFQGSGKNYLNIAYGSKSSHIDGTLNGGSNNIFLINPNGIVVGKGGSISAKKIVLSASSIGDSEMQEFASSGNIAGYEYKKGVSPVIKPNAGNVINTGNIKSDYIGIVAKQYANFDKDGNIGALDSSNGTAFLISDSVSVIKYFWNVGWIGGSVNFGATNDGDVNKNNGSTGSQNIQLADYIMKNCIVYKTNDKITSADIDSNVMNSIFSDLKFNSSVNIEDLSKFYKNGQELTAGELANISQSMDFITALYGQASASENASLKTALGSSYNNIEKGAKSISQIQAKISEISDLKTQQASNKAEYDKAVKEYEDAVKAYNTALKGLTGNNADTTLAGLKQAVDNAYKKVQDSISKNESYYTQLEGLKTEVSGISIDGTHKLTVSGSFDRNYAILPSINSGSNNSNNGNDGTDSGDINNGNNNGSNNNPNDTIGQQEPDIATALLMQTTDEDPNINEDDKQAS
ncbi:filamentous hemagglutinin N-terminal domain-containing protein, partial [Campylobacter jejuni]|nr:filamentous hemagglutinin N-terminal domain-containing protein [Campylobacter jejuni]